MCEPQHPACIAGSTAVNSPCHVSMLAHILQLCAALAAPVGAAFLAQESPDVCPRQAREKQTYPSKSQKKEETELCT